jgi:acid stress chaperone HdeB
MMKFACAFLTAAAMFSAAPAQAVVLDLSTMSCKQFVESGPDEIKMVLTWMDGWYKGDSDDAIIDTEVFVENAKKFGTYCAAHPTIAEKVLGD